MPQWVEEDVVDYRSQKPYQEGCQSQNQKSHRGEKSSEEKVGEWYDRVLNMKNKNQHKKELMIIALPGAPC